MTDAASSAKTIVWFKYNIWQFAWDPAYGFQSRYGFNLTALRGLNAAPTSSNTTPGFFDTITYKNLPFVKYYAYDSSTGAVNADPDVGLTAITDTTKAQNLVSMSNPKTGEQAPYVVRSGNFWYVADLPFSYIGPRDRYLVLADMLHDMLGVNHAESHKAMVRLEDVSALVSVTAMKSLTDYLYQQRIPFSIATIPYYKDPLGVYNSGVPMQVPMSLATNLKRALNYALVRGGEIVMHGYTHQYSNVRNRYTAVSGDDYEFWDIVNNKPVPEDSTTWALGRYRAGCCLSMDIALQPGKPRTTRARRWHPRPVRRSSPRLISAWCTTPQTSPISLHRWRRILPWARSSPTPSRPTTTARKCCRKAWEHRIRHPPDRSDLLLQLHMAGHSHQCPVCEDGA
jgi:uncharacterized protein YdaL